MAKKLNKICLLIFVLAVFCLSFPISQFFITNVAEAVAVEGLSGNNFVMVGFAGYEPGHFFVNDSNQSTLVNSKTASQGGEYNSIVSSGNGKSSGWGELRLTSDMKPFVDSGILYAKASGAVSVNDGQKMTLKISSGEATEQVEISNGRAETPLLRLTDFNQNVRFTFETDSNNFVLDLPTIHLCTCIDSVTLEQSSREVAPGELIKMNVYNDVTKISGVSGNFASLSKINHAIEYQFLSGKDAVEVIGTNILIKENAANLTKVTLRAVCNKNSYSAEKINSGEFITFTVNTNISMVDVQVRTDFSDPANFVGVGPTEKDKRITLTVQPNKGYEFLGWYVDGEFKTKNRKLTVNATFGQDIYAKFKKTIQIESIQIQGRVYDGTIDIDEKDAIVRFAGVEDGHELGLSGVKYAYVDASAGEKKAVTTQVDTLTLTGKDNDKYSLLNDKILPVAPIGEIFKRQVTITAQDAKKEYGDPDPTFSFTAQNVVGDEVLSGNLSRQNGESLGKYIINTGDLANKNSNYNFDIGEAFLEITQRTLFLENIVVAEKIYDKTTDAVITADLGNVYKNEDVKVNVWGQFVSVDAGENVEVTITKAELYGKDKQNYVLEDYTQKIYGKISPKPITITAQEGSCVYGQTPEFSFVSSEAAEFDGALEIESFEVGAHEIKVGTLSNPNYFIEKFVSANFYITPKPILVKAQKQTKTFGDEDAPFTYDAEGLVGNDTLYGELSREEGEDVGLYKILQGGLNNSNYDITFLENVFEIVPRHIVVKIKFLDKQYDGTLDVDFETTFENNIKNEFFDCKVEAKLSDKNSGKVNVQVGKTEVLTENKNYAFDFEVENNQIEISAREVGIFVVESSKTYGDDDPIFTYTARNAVEGEALSLSISRRRGENVGFYSYFLMYRENSNYNISLVNQQFEILPREIKVSVQNQSKKFGDEDPQIEFSLAEGLCFDDKQEDIIDGQVYRRHGENVGVYDYDFSRLSTSANYTFVNSANTNFIITKRPITVTIGKHEKVYGDADPTFDYEVSNDIEGQRFEAQIVRDYGEDVGTYRLICGTANDPRYLIEYVEGTLVINPYELTIKADEKVKIYGDEDPILTVSITKGFLKFNDRIDSLVVGNLDRKQGEVVGKYEINLGTLSFGKNYLLTFESGELTILQRHINIVANSVSKVYGEADPTLDFEIGGDGLVFGDEIEGALEREQGEVVGTYNILQGSIKTTENYYFDFVSGHFEITKKPIQIIPTTLSKEYGDEDKEIEYEIQGSLVGEDTLSGHLYRDTSKTQIGRYQIYSSLENENYEILLGTQYFTILPREIVVRAESYTINYGEKEPELSYSIVSGTILEGDEISGGIFRTPGNSVGTYDILSNLSINRNYNIVFMTGKLTILPLSLTIQSKNYQKIYGQEDPTFSYEIVSGELVNSDKLYGVLTREKGEDVGKYSLINGVYNENYNITLLPAEIEILRKDVKLISSVYNKIFDGTNTAYLKNPYVSGTVDDIYLQYERANCAEFESADVGNHIAVHLHDITIVGQKANNYNLIIPDVLYANITLPELEKDEVKVSAKEAVLQGDYKLNYSVENVKDSISVENKKIILSYNLWLENNQQKLTPNSPYTISIDIPAEVFAKNNVYVFQKDKDGKFVLVSSRKDENGKLIISANSLGEFYIAVEDETWLNIGVYVAFGIIALLGIFVLTKILSRHKRRKIIK